MEVIFFLFSNDKKKSNEISKNGESEDSESDSSSSSESESESDTEEEAAPPKAQNHNSKPPEKSNLDLLLDLDEIAPTGNLMTPSMGGFLTPMTPSAALSQISNKIELVGPSYVSMKNLELLNKVNGYGLGITYKYTRSPHLFSSNMVSIELQFTNHGNIELNDIQCVSKNLTVGLSMHEFAQITQLMPKQTLMGILGIDFNDSSQAANFEIKSSGGTSKVTFKPPMGELMRSVTLPEAMFKEQRNKLRGMTESTCKVQNLKAELNDKSSLRSKIFEVANVAAISHNDDENILLFAGQTMNSKNLVLITVTRVEDSATITVNCEKVVVGSILINEIRDAIKV